MAICAKTMEDNKFETPKLRRLGLGRIKSVQSVQSAPSAVGLRVRNDLFTDTPTNSKSARESDGINVEVQSKIASISLAIGATTPITTANAGVRPRAACTENRRPYRLTLSSAIRNQLTKKRLEFHQANSKLTATNNDETRDETYNAQATKRLKLDNHEFAEKTESPIEAGMYRTVPLAEIPQFEQKTDALESHNRKRKELESAIGTWKLGFQAAMTELQAAVVPRQPIAVLLEQLRIPQRMLQYLEDD